MEEADKGWLMIRIDEWVNVFFWYGLTRVVPDKGHKTVVVACCVLSSIKPSQLRCIYWRRRGSGWPS